MSTTALLLSACTQPGSDSTDQSAKESSASAVDFSVQAPEGFEEYYSQPIDWKVCELEQIDLEMSPELEGLENYECATLTAPMDWLNPESEAIELSIARYLGAEAGSEAPPLFFNLGGPGGASVGLLNTVVEGLFTPQLLDAFQVIALDPRGVGASSPIWCMTDEERDASQAEFVDATSTTWEERAATYAEKKVKLGAQCLERNGDILGFVDSDSAARDFDMARAALGFEKMDYLGLSYGTLLGATYAELFPDHVGHFVLDGALDNSLNFRELYVAQAKGLENSLYHWIETCQAGPDCPLTGDLEAGKQQMIDMLAAIRKNPLPTQDKDRDLNIHLAYTGIIGAMYRTGSYPQLVDAVHQALDGDGSGLLSLSDDFNDRGVDGTYITNSDDAYVAINALDYPAEGTVEEWIEESKMLTEKFPVLGEYFGFSSAGLDAWPVKATVTRHVITAPDAPDILVVGTTNDPATPYVMAEKLNHDLENSVLLTVEGWGHIAYGAGASACVRDTVDGFLLTGELPEVGRVCSE